MEELREPIRLMFGFGNNLVQGFSIITENDSGRPWVINILYNNKSPFNKIRFSDTKNEVVWIKESQDSKFKIKEIIIKRKG